MMYPCLLSKLLIITIIVTIIIVFQSIIVGAHDLLDVPLSDPLYQDAYDFIDRIVAQRFVKGVVKNTRPYSRGEVVEILNQLSNLVKQNQVKLSRIEQKRLEKLLSLLAIERYGNEVSIPSRTGQDLVNSGRYAFLEAKGNQYHFTLDVEVGEEVVSRNVSDSEEKIGYITMLRPTASGRVYRNFAFLSDLKFYYLSGEQFEDIPKTEARSVQADLGATTAATTTAYALFKAPWFGLLLGKDRLHWGPGRHGALLVSDNPLPMNMVKLIAHYPSGSFKLQKGLPSNEVKGPNIKFHAFTGTLGSGISRKYLSGHRVEMNVRDRINFGIAETIVFANRFETIYLNPLQIYTVTELPVKVIRGEGLESPDNVLISGDFDLLLKNLSVYGELMIDDFQPNYGWRSYRHWGSKFGLLFGLYYINPPLPPFFKGGSEGGFPDSELRLEYAFINQYAYTHDNNTNYTHSDSVIGHWIGSDADVLWVNFKHWFTGDFHASVSFELKRHGEGNVNKPHPKDAPFEEEWEFLSGITGSISSLSLSLSYTSVGRYLAEFVYTLSWAKNVDNQLNRKATEHQFVLQGHYRF